MVCASTFMSAGYSVFFSLSEFLLTHSGFATLLFMGRSAECCRCVLQFSCWDCVPGYRRLYLLSCMFTCTSCWISFITRARISRIHRLAGRPYNDIWILFGISCAIRLLHFDTSVGAPILELSTCFFILSFWKLHCLRGDLFLISASLGGETYCVSLSAMSISRCRAGEWPNDKIMFIFGRSHLFPGLHIWPIFCQWNRIHHHCHCVWSVASFHFHEFPK